MRDEARIRGELGVRLADARTRTDALFGLLRPDAWLDRPIPERHRNIFYLGHLEAFDWNMVCRSAFENDSFQEEFDRIFAFGIDPIDGNLPSDQPGDWPPADEIRRYNQRARTAVDACLNRGSFSGSHSTLVRNGFIFQVAIEHRLMHAETLAYMLHQLSARQKDAPPNGALPTSPPVKHRSVEIPAGTTTLGLAASGEDDQPFGWDNEFEPRTVSVPSFAIDVYNVTNGQFLEFVRSGGYQDRSLWSASSWDWITRRGITHPKFWQPSGDSWFYQSIFTKIGLPLDWPVYVSHAEASAYARWVGKALPTEAQWHRAALGTPSGPERDYPWGNEPPNARRGNFDFASWDPSPVGSHPAGNSAFGVADLVGNGWEWTSTAFSPFPGFKPFPFYPGYSAEFFDGQHYVLKGGSARTAACLLRHSFRNWFQPHYPYVYAAFRCVEN